MNKHLYFVVAEVTDGKVSKVQDFQMDDYLPEAFPTDKPVCQIHGNKMVYGFGIHSDRRDEQQAFKNIFTSLLV